MRHVLLIVIVLTILCEECELWDEIRIVYSVLQVRWSDQGGLDG